MQAVSLHSPLIVRCNINDPGHVRRTVRKNDLTRRKRTLSHILEYKVHNALSRKYNNNGLISGDESEWDTIEELSATLNDITTELDILENERECWDEIECLIYDV